MKVIICGSREGCTGVMLDEAVRASGWAITEIVTGGGRGVDTMADLWAIREQKDRVIFHANWERYGKTAGPLRNARMAAYADACIALPGGRGTADMVSKAREAGLLVYEVKP